MLAAKNMWTIAVSAGESRAVVKAVAQNETKHVSLKQNVLFSVSYESTITPGLATVDIFAFCKS